MKHTIVSFFQGHKQLVLEGVTSFFNRLDETCRKEDKEDRWVTYYCIQGRLRCCYLLNAVTVTVKL